MLKRIKRLKTAQTDSSIQGQLLWASRQIDPVSESPLLDAEILLCHVLGKPRSHLLAWPEKTLDQPALQQFHKLVALRTRPTPVAYLTGEREFYSLSFKTTAATLVPRPETELLVEQAIALCMGKAAINVLELGTGTGAIALSIKKHCPHAAITATDISEAALQVARENAQKLELEVDWLVSDWFQALPLERYHLIVSNPPYIAQADPYLKRGDLPAEPQIALSSGPSGLEALQEIIGTAPQWLLKEGVLMVEHGYDQQQAVHQLFVEEGFVGIVTQRDINGLPRMTAGQLLDD